MIDRNKKIRPAYNEFTNEKTKDDYKLKDRFLKKDNSQSHKQPARLYRAVKMFFGCLGRNNKLAQK